MSKAKILSEEAISIYDLKKSLSAIKKRDEELGFRAAKTEEYIKSFAKLDAKSVDAIKKELEALEIPRMKSEHICKLLDILPTDEDDVKLVLQGYTLTVTNDNIKKIADVIKSHKK